MSVELIAPELIRLSRIAKSIGLAKRIKISVKSGTTPSLHSSVTPILLKFCEVKGWKLSYRREWWLHGRHDIADAETMAKELKVKLVAMLDAWALIKWGSWTTVAIVTKGGVHEIYNKREDIPKVPILNGRLSASDLYMGLPGWSVENRDILEYGHVPVEFHAGLVEWLETIGKLTKREPYENRTGTSVGQIRARARRYRGIALLANKIEAGIFRDRDRGGVSSSAGAH